MTQIQSKSSSGTLDSTSNDENPQAPASQNLKDLMGKQGALPGNQYGQGQMNKVMMQGG